MSQWSPRAAFLQALQRTGTELESFEPAAASADAIGRALHRLADERIGARLFTLMRFDAASGEACRVYTSDAEHYPVSGTKALPRNRWSARVIERQRLFVANDLAGIAAVFPDHALIDSLGCQAVLNLPIVSAGQVIGTVNCLHVAGHYTPERVRAAEALVLPGRVALLSLGVTSPSG